jgi:hypothetical protein
MRATDERVMRPWAEATTPGASKLIGVQRRLDLFGPSFDVALASATTQGRGDLRT